MEYLKKYQDFEPLNEEFSIEDIKHFISNIIGIPFILPLIILLQFLPVKLIKTTIENSLNVYFNRGKIMSYLEMGLKDRELTDSAKRKIDYNLRALKKSQKKYPTLDDFKKGFKKKVFMYSFANKEYLKNVIDDYQPRLLDGDEIIEQLKKSSKELTGGSIAKYNKDKYKSIDPFGEENW